MMNYWCCTFLNLLFFLFYSKNRMAIDMPEETMSQLSINFANLGKLNISVCDYNWSDIIVLSHLWPKIHEVIAAYNRIKKITPPDVTLNTLTILRLDGNPIDSWVDVVNLGRLKNLKVLSLNDCLIESISFNNKPGNANVDVFENLEVLFLNRNRISDVCKVILKLTFLNSFACIFIFYFLCFWTSEKYIIWITFQWRSVSELNKLKNLKKLYFLKNPIQNTEDYDTGSQLIIAKIGTLQVNQFLISLNNNIA